MLHRLIKDEACMTAALWQEATLPLTKRVETPPDKSQQVCYPTCTVSPLMSEFTRKQIILTDVMFYLIVN